MKQKFNYWIIYFFLTVGSSFLLSDDNVDTHAGNISMNKGELGTIKLSGKMPSIHDSGKILIIRD